MMALDVVGQDQYQKRIDHLSGKITFISTAIAEALNDGGDGADEELDCLKTQKVVLEKELQQVKTHAEAAAGYTDEDPDDTLGERAMP